jgi:hypothetical protein
MFLAHPMWIFLKLLFSCISSMQEIKSSLISFHNVRFIQVYEYKLTSNKSECGSFKK